MAIPKVMWSGKLYESYGDINEEAIIQPALKQTFDLKVKELDEKGGLYVIHIDLFGNIERVVEE